MSDEIPEETKFIPSCGCVFCDVGLEPDGSKDGRPTHSHPTRGRRWSFCTNPALDAALATLPGEP